MASSIHYSLSERSKMASIERFPGVERVVMDGIEPAVQRPTGSEKQKLNYSGKKSLYLANI